MSAVFEILPGKLYGSSYPGRAASQEEFVKEALSLGIVTIVSLQEAPPDTVLVNHLKKHGVNYVHLPVDDFAAPSENDVESVRRCYRNAVKSGRGLLIHCTSGFGRTGTAAAAVLVAEEGMSARDAIDLVRRVRPGAIETSEQECFVLGYAGRIAQHKYKKKHRKQDGSA
jgi:protein-tyrosine phosphatase